MKLIFPILIFLIFISFPLFNNTIQANPIDSLKESQIIGFQNIAPKGRFELGIEFGVFSTDVEYLLYYKEFLKGIQEGGYEVHHSMINGVRFAHILNKKWWLQTGIRYGRSTWSRDILFDAFYDKSFEQIQPDGEVHYDLTLVSLGSISEVEININTSVTNSFSLDNNDLVVSAFLVETQLDWLQIPIGLAYRLGKKQLNFAINGGLSLNQITTNNYNLEGLIESSNSRFLIHEIIYPEKKNTRFLGTYLGVELRYNLKKNIILHGNFNLRYEPKIRVYVNDVFMGFHFGGSYLF